MGETHDRWYRQWWAVVLLIAIVIGATGVLTVKALGLRSVRINAQPMAQPTSGFDYTWWNTALARWVRDGRVDYGAVLSDEKDLRRFVATLQSTGPKATPDRFTTEPERLAYYINAYNALVMLGVVDNWPITSVQDVQGWLDPRAGFGFFYGLRFPLDGGKVTLYELENQVIRGFLDARIHAAINCASKSCPALADHAFEGATLDDQLNAVTSDFCSRDQHVHVDTEAEEIQLSAIFDWYRADFEEHARRLGRPATILDFIIAFAAPEVSAELERARDADFKVVFRPYDWTLNAF
ncbi:MAG: DUF547 domain-containing protein [Polyangiales bacterium]